jgi:hypothetical protein
MARDALANTIALAVALLGMGTAAIVSRRFRLTLLDLFRPGTIRAEDFKEEPTETSAKAEAKITVQIEEPVISGGVMLERDRPKTRGITGSTPAFGTPGA